MAAKTKVFDGPVTTAQAIVLFLWFLFLGSVGILWYTTSLTQFQSGTAGLLTSIGQIFGLLAVFFALTQFFLMGRIAWIEKPFGLDKLASYHRINGYLTIICIMIHPLFIIAGYTTGSGQSYFAKYYDVIIHYQYVIWALIAQLFFLAVVVSSIYIVRKKLKFESWYITHLLVYAAIVLAFFHQLAVGTGFQGHPAAKTYWYIVYAIVFLNVLSYRFMLPTLNLLRFEFIVQKVVKETPTTTSVYIGGRNLDRWKHQPGQFVLIRILNKQLWKQEHPFSLSQVPQNDQFRITVRNVGDYTAMIADLQPGAKVLVSGPFGRFTKNLAQTKKRLFIAGGVGITPLRTLAEEALADNMDSVLLFGNRYPEDTVLKAEIDELESKGLRVIHVYSGAPDDYKGETGYIDIDKIKRLCPDYAERDIYLCGPPVMMNGVVDGLTISGVQPDRLHYERFSLHA